MAIPDSPDGASEANEKIRGVYNERKREPLPQAAVCFACGWSGTPDHTVLSDVNDAPSVMVASKRCRKCGSPTVQLKAKPPVVIEIVTALRAADLTPEELSAVADAIRDAPDGISPRVLAERVPFASQLITVAARAGKNWRELLAVVVLIATLYVAQVAHQDADRAHSDAQVAHQDSAARKAGTTGALSDDDVQRIAEQVEADSSRDRAP